MAAAGEAGGGAEGPLVGAVGARAVARELTTKDPGDAIREIQALAALPDRSFLRLRLPRA